MSKEITGLRGDKQKAWLSRESETHRISALIVACSDPFRESLAVLIRSIPQIEHIRQVKDLASALSDNASRPPDLMLCDFASVQDETVDTLRYIKSLWPQVHCVVLVEDKAAYHQAEAVGADVVLTKGVLAAKLLETIEELLFA